MHALLGDARVTGTMEIVWEKPKFVAAGLAMTSRNIDLTTRGMRVMAFKRIRTSPNTH